MLSTSRLRDAITPIGRPMATDMTTETTMSAMVSMVFSHRPMNPKYSIAPVVKAISSQRPTAYESMASPTMMTGHGTHLSTSSIFTSE